MARFAPIGPAHLLKRLREHQSWNHLLGRYHLVLAHDIVANSKLWEKEQVLPPESIVIIDNSIIELGRPVGMSEMKEAFDILGPMYRKIIVLPDVFDDPDETHHKSEIYLNHLQKVFTNEQAEYMLVLQAGTREHMEFEYIAQRNWDLLMKGVTWLSVPRRVCDRFGTRAYMLASVFQVKLLQPQIKVHLLGFSENVLDDAYCATYPWVEGIDSAVPVRLGQRGIPFNLAHKGDQAGPRGTFWEDPHDILDPMLYENLSMCRITMGANQKSIPPYTPQLREEYL